VDRTPAHVMSYHIYMIIYIMISYDQTKCQDPVHPASGPLILCRGSETPGGLDNCAHRASAARFLAAAFFSALMRASSSALACASFSAARASSCAAYPRPLRLNIY
jgi:hypothetical protein